MIERGNLIIDGALVPEDVDPDTWTPMRMSDPSWLSSRPSKHP